MPKTGEQALEAGEYSADWHWTIFMRVGMVFPPCPECHQVVEYTKVARSDLQSR